MQPCRPRAGARGHRGRAGARDPAFGSRQRPAGPPSRARPTVFTLTFEAQHIHVASHSEAHARAAPLGLHPDPRGSRGAASGVYFRFAPRAPARTESRWPVTGTRRPCHGTHLCQDAELPRAAHSWPTPPAPNGCAEGGGRSSPSPGALRQQSQRPRFSPAVRQLSHLILARLGTVFRAPREGPDPALQPGRQTAAPADGRGAPAWRGRPGPAQEARPTPALAPLAVPGSGKGRRGEAGRPKPHGSPHQRRLSTVPSGPRVTGGPATRAPAPAEGGRPRGGPRGRLQPLGAGPPGGFPQRVGWDRCASHPRRPAGLGCGKLPKGQCRSEGWALAGGQEGFRRR